MCAALVPCTRLRLGVRASVVTAQSLSALRRIPQLMPWGAQAGRAKEASHRARRVQVQPRRGRFHARRDLLLLPCAAHGVRRPAH